jgi:uncharacterized protein
MMPRLDTVQRRVLGVLLEKALTTPGSYPLTLNALVAGCNQLSCRDPVLKLSEDEVAKGIRELEELRLVSEIAPDRNARVERYRHNTEEQYGWNQYRQAVMAELLLRGPQTPGELKGNASRMAPLPDLDAVLMILQAFVTEQLVRELPRQPGKRESRFDHLVYAEEKAPAATSAAGPAPAASTLEDRVARLETEVAILRQELQNLRPRQPQG